MKEFYIVLSQSGTLTSKFLKANTKDEFNHASITFDTTLMEMYSFARIHKHFPLYGGFVKESKDTGVFGAHKNNALIQILRFETDDDKFEYLKNIVFDMYESKKDFKYNLKGVFYARFGKEYHKEKHYFCSEFIKKILIDANIIDESVLPPITKPVDFQSLPAKEIIYFGKLADYNKES